MTIPRGEATGDAKPVVIKKYANRRLYNTATSSYVTLEDLAKIVKQGGDFAVYDAKTGDDITRSVLAQIILEAEQKGGALLPLSFLRQLIGLYGDSMQFLVPGYLEEAMRAFARNQEQLRKSFEESFKLFPFGHFGEVGKQNLALFEQALKMFAPFPREENASDGPVPPKEDPEKARLERLQAQIDALTRQLQTLERQRKRD